MFGLLYLSTMHSLAWQDPWMGRTHSARANSVRFARAAHPKVWPHQTRHCIEHAYQQVQYYQPPTHLINR